MRVVSSPSAATVRLAKNKNMTGTKNNESNVEDVSPPTTDNREGLIGSVPFSSAMAVGMRQSRWQARHRDGHEP